MKLGDYIIVNPESIRKEYPFSEIEYIDISSVDTAILKGTQCLPLEKAPSRAKRIVKEGDTLLATVRPNLRSFWYAQRTKKNTVASTGFAVLRAKEEIDPRFLYYTVTTQDFSAFLSANVKGAAYPAVDTETIQRADVFIPPLPTQRKIAAILSAYDDLIENNMRRIKILDNMAQSLYQEWFVKFRFPGHGHVRFVDSPLGKIPEGWEIKLLKDIIINHIGGGWGKDQADPKHTEPAWVVRGTDLPNLRYCNISGVPFRYHSASNLKKRILEERDIIFEVSGGSKDQPLGRCILISSELLRVFGGFKIICASFCKKIKPKDTVLASSILYLSFLDAYNSGEIENYQVQSTGISNFKWSDYINKVYRIIPNKDIQNRFCEIFNDLFGKVNILGLKNFNLRKTRDLLLPKLISGEVDVSNLDIDIPEEISV